jgi:hypothetical protein
MEKSFHAKNSEAPDFVSVARLQQSPAGLQVFNVSSI